ncbi:MAG: hypothetical protein Q9167_004195 [Letrouitia subvulpina]
MAGMTSTGRIDGEKSQEQSAMSRIISPEDCMDDRKFQRCSGISGPASSDNQTVVQSSRAMMTNGPNIEWMPSRETYEARVRELGAQGVPRSKDLPAGFPKHIEGARAWTGSEFTKETSFVLQISTEEVHEIEKALKSFKDSRSGKDLAMVMQRTFPLPLFGKKLKEMSKIVHSGRGFAVIRGLDPEKFSRMDNVIIYLGVTSYIAEMRGRQDSTGSMLLHVKDMGDRVQNANMRQSPYANCAQPFHNDIGDVLAMYVLNTAKEGGDSLLASGATVYNEIATTRPDVIKLLAEDSWVFDKHDGSYQTRPLLFPFRTHGPGFCYSRRPITGSPTSPRPASIPPMTESQAEALDMVHFTAAKHQLALRLRKGDIQLINNLAVMHGRNGFSDGPAEHEQRHLLRLWLRNEALAWETPGPMKGEWEMAYGKSQGQGQGREGRWDTEPVCDRERIVSCKEVCA